MASLFGKGAIKPHSRVGSKPFGDHSKMPPMSEPSRKMPPERPMGSGGGSETTITHHPGGEMEVHHSDGEVSKHPNAGHMAAHIHAKHMGGEAGNMHCDDAGKCTTHHVGMDGEVSGPSEHASPQEGADHLAQMMSGSDMNEVQGYEPDGDESSSLM